MPEGTDTRLTLLHTSDLHSRLFPYDLAPLATDRNLGLHQANAPFGGAARLAYLIKRERERSQRVLHLDSGDCFQGAPIFNLNLGEAELRFFSLIELDAAVIGNHEFDAGVENLVTQLDAWAKYDVLAANYRYPNPDNPGAHGLGRVARPYSIYNLQGLSIAVIGMGNLGSLTSIGEGGNSLQLRPTEQNETVRALVNTLHNQVDLILVLTHLGLHEDRDLILGYEKVVWPDRIPTNNGDPWEIRETLADGRVRVFIPGVRGIDAILGGHLHTVLNPPQLIEDRDGRQVILAHSGAFAKYLGRLDVVAQDDPVFGRKRIVAHKYQLFPVDNRLSGYEDPAVMRMLEPYQEALEQALDLNRTIAYAPKTILRRGEGNAGDSPLGNILADSMRNRQRVEAEFAMTNTLGMRDNFYQGPITLETMFNVFPFENTLTVMYLSGREIQETFDFVADKSTSRGCQSQVQVSGLSFVMNCAQSRLNRQELERLQSESTSSGAASGSLDPRNRPRLPSPAQNIRINGRPLDPNATYKAATNDYMARGGSGFRVLKRNTTKFDTGVSMRDALIDAFATLPRCAAYELEHDLCGQPDSLSQKLCHDMGGPGRIPNHPDPGPYAHIPCVTGRADPARPRIIRQISLSAAPNEAQQ